MKSLSQFNFSDWTGKILVTVSVLIFIGVSVGCFLHYTLPLGDHAQFLDISLAGLYDNEAQVKIEEKLDFLLNKPVIFELEDGGQLSSSLSQLGVDIQVHDLVSYVISSGRRWSFNGIRRSFAAFPVKQESPVLQAKSFAQFIRADYQTLKTRVKVLLATQLKDPVSAKIRLEDKKYLIFPAEKGRYFQANELARLTQTLLYSARDFQSPPTMKVRFDEPKPVFSQEDIQLSVDNLNAFLQNKLVFKIAENQYEHFLYEFGDIWSIDGRGHVKLNTLQLSKWVEGFVDQHTVLPGRVIVSSLKGEESEYNKTQITRAVYSGEFNHGLEIDEKDLTVQIESLFNRDFSLKERKKLEPLLVKYKDLHPKLISQVEDFDFPDLISTGVSSFLLGRSAGRVKNIELSLQALQGVVLMPGEEVSFNSITGWITPKKGYQQTKVILNGEVKKGVGGGVCQVSTTLFRSVVDAGLPLLERKNHTLDIVYYHKYGHGIDAAVYQDSKMDFRFVNDMSTPLFVHAYTDDKYRAFVEFYGKDDGRKVDLIQLKGKHALHKKWAWNVTYPDGKEDKRLIESVYHPEKKPEESQVDQAVLS